MDANTAFNIFLGIMAAGLLIGAIFYPLWAILHRSLPKKLDNILFRKPYFSDTELVNYQFFPLSLVKSINYIYLIALPRWAKRKRFRGLDVPLPVGTTSRLLCKIQFSVGLIGLAMFFVFFGYGGIALLVYG